MAEIFKIYQENPQDRVIKKAVSVLKNGGVIIYPTDTTYGLGADIYNKKGIERILQIKGESKSKFLSFICDDFKNLHQYVHISNFAYKVLKRALPGRYTFILEATKLVPKLMIHNKKTAGIRVPDDEFCQRLVAELGHPIVSTSLPVEQGYFVYEPEDIIERFEKRVDLIIESGPLYEQPSTVVDLTDSEIVIIREGSGDIDRLY